MSVKTIQVAVLRVRSGLKAGNIVCYQDQGGYLVPVNAPCTPIDSSPPPLSPGSGPWLNCQACTGTKVGQGRLKDVTCEVCSL
jgi:hypothetical protein